MAAAGEICRRVDGIPLAIELAAARVAAMTPSEIAAHLDERFRLLTGSRRGRVERHQTLRATVEWSYQLLEPVERTVFDRLGVFAGSFEATGVVAVACHDDLDRWQAVDAVASLVAKSMLAAEDGPGGTTRYAMLETLRQFSRDQLDQTGEADAWRRRWAQYYAEFAETAGAGFKGADDELWAQRIYADLDNVRAAISWGLDTGDPADGRLAVRMLVGLADFAQENRAAAVMARAADAIAVARGAPPELRSPALGLAAYHEMNQGNPDVARAIAEDALARRRGPDVAPPVSRLDGPGLHRDAHRQLRARAGGDERRTAVAVRGRRLHRGAVARHRRRLRRTRRDGRAGARRCRTRHRARANSRRTGP